ncbi:MAG: hypothetical protein Kow0099_05270 [Candidatus Abyssubacteria bacterium]
MNDKGSPPSRPYVYAFSSGRLVVLACMVLALTALSVMLGIRIERFQQSGGSTTQAIHPSVPLSPDPNTPPVPALTPPPAQTESPVEETGAPETSLAMPAPPPQSAPAQPAAAEKEAPPKPTPPPAPAPKAETPKPQPSPKPKPQPVQQKPVEQKPAPTATTPSVQYAVQVSSSQDKTLAASQIDILKGKGFPAYPEEVEVGGKRFFRVMVGPYPNEDAARKVLDQIVKDSRFSDSYVRHVP